MQFNMKSNEVMSDFKLLPCYIKSKLFTTFCTDANGCQLWNFESREVHNLCDLLCDLRAKVLVACLITPALWLNLSDSRNILIIHFGLLLKERTLDSIGHDLWKKYNVICLLWMIHYIFTQWILIDA